MNIDLARNIIRTALTSGRELQALLGPLKEQCDADQYRDFAQSIAAAIDSIGSKLINRTLAAYPELASEVEASIARHGRYL